MNAHWEPPRNLSREELVTMSDAMLGRPDLAIEETETIERIESLGLEWDVGAMVYAPRDLADYATGRDGRHIAMFVLHGGSGDYRSMERLCRLLSGKLGCKVVSMTYPGRLYLNDPSRDWPGDTIAGDGPDRKVRTPIWLRGEEITSDQYELIEDTALRARYGTRLLARARPGTKFYDRMASWPAAFEDAMKHFCRELLPQDLYSIYVHGHSTGGPFVHMLTQRVDNIVGVVGIENSPFANIYRAMIGYEWPGPFNELSIRTWRDLARYKGAEVRSLEGEDGLMRLPWVMEEVFEAWDEVKDRPQFKAEYPMHYASKPGLTAAARASAKRLGLDDADTQSLVARYLGFCHELSGPDVRPVPPILLSICKHSRDHTATAYANSVIPMFARIDPAPKVRVVQLGTGTHHYEKAEDSLPMGLVAPVAELWFEAIMKGYYNG
ncbi:MAG: hypothetical protein VX741_00850 [Pseudomonadota bacterium]|nr:hypothetical protein [Pseudomonadota bacterium]